MTTNHQTTYCCDRCDKSLVMPDREQPRDWITVVAFQPMKADWFEKDHQNFRLELCHECRASLDDWRWNT